MRTNEYDIPFKICEVSDFGKNYQNIMAKKNISQMLCPANVDFVLEGYYTMERYSYIKLNFQKCVNTTKNNNHCYPNEIIDKYLAITKIDTKLQDIELTPHYYNNPVRYLEREISGTSFKDLMPQISVEMKIVIIETDNNIIGFEGLSTLKIDKYLKYDSKTINAIPITSVYNSDDANNILNEIKIQLSSNILYQKRTYVQLIDVLGDVGGLMEIINMIFNVICSLIVNLLYNKSLVNNLFSFDLNKKLVILKNKNNEQIRGIDINKEILPKNKFEKKDNFKIRKTNRNINIIKNFYTPKYNHSFFEINNKSSRKIIYDLYDNKRKDIQINRANTIIEDNVDKKNSTEVNHNNYRLNSLDNNFENRNNIIKKVRANKLCVYLCFCILKGNKNVNNILFDEGMKLIIKNLDIFNVFKRLFEISEFEILTSKEDIKVQMSDECKEKIHNIINKNFPINQRNKF